MCYLTHCRPYPLLTCTLPLWNCFRVTCSLVPLPLTLAVVGSDGYCLLHNLSGSNGCGYYIMGALHTCGAFYRQSECRLWLPGSLHGCDGCAEWPCPGH